MITPTAAAPIPVTLRAPLLPPLKEPVGMVMEEVEEDLPVNGVAKLEVGVMERPELRKSVGEMCVVTR